MCLFDCCFEKKEKKQNKNDNELNSIMQQIYIIRENTNKKINEIIEKKIKK
jgi:hypothetical protein